MKKFSSSLYRHILPGIILTIIAFSFFIIGCAGDSGGGDDKDGGDVAPLSPTVNTGIFVDSPVSNISYETDTQSGITNVDGEFTYVDGEFVTFFIGDLLFPTVDAGPIITPMTLADTTDSTDPQVTNIARLLQSLDEDGDPTNGIAIPAGAADIAVPVNFDVDTTTFENDPDVSGLVEHSGSVTTDLLPVEDVIEHLEDQFGVAGTWRGDAVPGVALVLLDNGRFVIFDNSGGEDEDGMESGTYSFNSSANTITFTVTYDNNGDEAGINDVSGEAIPMSLTDSQLTLSFTDEDFVLNKQPVGETIVGTWLYSDGSLHLVLFQDGRFMFGEEAGGEPNGMEAGTYVYDSNAGEISFNVTFDKNGEAGINDDGEGSNVVPIPAILNGNQLTLTGDEEDDFDFYRQHAEAGGDSGSDSDIACADPIIDATGSWSITETSTDNDCGEDGLASYTLIITQSGNNVSVYSPGLDQTFSGQMCGNTITWTGSYPEDGGTTVLDPITAEVSVDNLSGINTWRWSDGVNSCSGTTEFVGDK